MKEYQARFVGEVDRDSDLLLANYGYVGDFSIVNIEDPVPPHPTRYFRLVCPCSREHFLPLDGTGVHWDLVSADPPHIRGSILSYCTYACDHPGAVENSSTHCHVLIENGLIRVLDDTTAPLSPGAINAWGEP